MRSNPLLVTSGMKAALECSSNADKGATTTKPRTDAYLTPMVVLDALANDAPGVAVRTAVRKGAMVATTNASRLNSSTSRVSNAGVRTGRTTALHLQLRQQATLLKTRLLPLL